MISVVTLDRLTGGVVDRADAPDPESAVVAARTLLDDASGGAAGAGSSFYANFYGPDGKLVRAYVTRSDLYEGSTT